MRIGDLGQDFRFALRTFRKSPVFVAAAVCSLALGIGANTAIFTLMDQLLLRMLPVRHPEQLVMLTSTGQHYGSNNGSNRISYPMYTDFRDKNDVFDGMFCMSETDMSASYEGKTERVAGELVSGNYYRVLGVQAVLGRVFTAQDDLYQGAHPLAVLSYGYWQRRFGADRSVVGRKIVVNGYPLTIIGVSQAGFVGTDPVYAADIRVPIMMKSRMDPMNYYSLNERRGRWVTAFGRLKPGVSLTIAKARLQPLFHQILQMEVRLEGFAKASAVAKQKFLKMSMDVLPASRGRSDVRQQFSKPLIVLMATVALVLLIACANVANLLIARATARRKEISVRLALGASRRRLISQLVVESCLLSLAGGVAGLALAMWMDKVLLGFMPASTTTLNLSATPDWRILGFDFLLAIVTGVVFGLVPALQATRPDLVSTLKDQAAAVVGGGSVGVRKTLVVAQVALSLLLLIGAGLFIRSLRNLKDLDPGFRTSNLLEFSVDPTLSGYTPARSRDFYRRLQESVKALPGVSHASLAVMGILDGSEWDSSMTTDMSKPGESAQPHMNFVSPGYFETLEIPLLVGRDFRDSDVLGMQKVAIVNEKFAKKNFGTTNAIGHRIGLGGDPGTKTDTVIVGVVRDTKYESMRDEMPDEVFEPYHQLEFVLGMRAYVRTEREAEQMFGTLRSAINRMDPDLPVYDLRTLEKQMENSLVTERLVAILSSAFGLVATLLAAIGLYGVMAYTVARRTREIGIRIAIGAATADVVWLVMREVLNLVIFGIVIALPAAFLLTRFVTNQLYGIQPTDPATIVLSTLGVAAVALLAGYVPARRATRVDPIRALRYE